MYFSANCVPCKVFWTQVRLRMTLVQDGLKYVIPSLNGQKLSINIKLEKSWRTDHKNKELGDISSIECYILVCACACACVYVCMCVCMCVCVCVCECVCARAFL